VQITTDGHKAYLEAIEGAFAGDVDYAQLIKLYGASPDSSKGRYSPAECTGIKERRIEGNPDIGHVSTSYVERMNLNIRMGNRRFTRLTNGFSKRIDNHLHMLSLYFLHYIAGYTRVLVCRQLWKRAFQICCMILNGLLALSTQ
jgi:hypothetical protein